MAHERGASEMTETTGTTASDANLIEVRNLV
jgi:hypothetical protein